MNNALMHCVRGR